MHISYREYTEADKELLISFQKKLVDYIKSVDPIQRIINKSGLHKINVKQGYTDPEFEMLQVI